MNRSLFIGAFFGIAMVGLVGYGPAFKTSSSFPSHASKRASGISDRKKVSAQPIQVTATISSMDVQSNILKSLSIHVEENAGGKKGPNKNPNVPLTLGSDIHVTVNQTIPKNMHLQVGDWIGIGLTKTNTGWISTLNTNDFIPLYNWFHISSPQSGQAVYPSQSIRIKGLVTQKSMWGQNIDVSFLAGTIKPSNTFYHTIIPIKDDGKVNSTVNLPKNPFPSLNGDGITLLMQPIVHQGPITQIILLPKTK